MKRESVIVVDSDVVDDGAVEVLLILFDFSFRDHREKGEGDEVEVLDSFSRRTMPEKTWFTG